MSLQTSPFENGVRVECLEDTGEPFRWHAYVTRVVRPGLYEVQSVHGGSTNVLAHNMTLIHGADAISRAQWELDEAEKEKITARIRYGSAMRRANAARAHLAQIQVAAGLV